MVADVALFSLVELGLAFTFASRIYMWRVIDEINAQVPANQQCDYTFFGGKTYQEILSQHKSLFPYSSSRQKTLVPCLLGVVCYISIGLWLTSSIPARMAPVGLLFPIFLILSSMHIVRLLREHRPQSPRPDRHNLPSPGC